MPDDTYQPKVYRKDGGNTQVVADGGKIDVKAGGQILVGGTDFAAVLGGIPTADPEVSNAIWLDGTTLKVSAGGG